jgi:hypothetical protein
MPASAGPSTRSIASRTKNEKGWGMTSQQRSILIVLGLANLSFLCCLIPAAIILLTAPPSQDLLQPVRNVQPIGSSSSNSTASRTPASPPQPGWKLFSVAADNFAIPLPESWKQLPLDQLTLAVDLDAVGKQNPEFSGLPGAQTASVASLVKFIGVETALDGSVGNFSTNVNVLHRTQPLELPLDLYISISLKALQDLPYGGRPILHRRVQTLAGPAEEFSYSNAIRLINGQTVNTANRQYMLLHGKEFFVIACSTPVEQEFKYAPICEKIAAGFQWTGN